jgi:hypothetical protein
VTRLAAYRTLWRAPLSNSSTEKLLEFSVKFFALSNQLFNADDLGVYVHLHHLPSPSEYIKRATASVLHIQELKTLAMFRISPRTIEIYRANVMTKMQAASLSDLVRMALVAGVLDAKSG